MGLSANGLPSAWPQTMMFLILSPELDMIHLSSGKKQSHNINSKVQVQPDSSAPSLNATYINVIHWQSCWLVHDSWEAEKWLLNLCNTCYRLISWLILTIYHSNHLVFISFSSLNVKQSAATSNPSLVTFFNKDYNDDILLGAWR